MPNLLFTLGYLERSPLGARTRLSWRIDALIYPINKVSKEIKNLKASQPLNPKKAYGLVFSEFTFIIIIYRQNKTMLIS